MKNIGNLEDFNSIRIKKIFEDLWKKGLNTTIYFEISTQWTILQSGEILE